MAEYWDVNKYGFNEKHDPEGGGSGGMHAHRVKIKLSSWDYDDHYEHDEYYLQFIMFSSKTQLEYIDVLDYISNHFVDVSDNVSCGDIIVRYFNEDNQLTNTAFAGLNVTPSYTNICIGNGTSIIAMRQFDYEYLKTKQYLISDDFIA